MRLLVVNLLFSFIAFVAKEPILERRFTVSRSLTIKFLGSSSYPSESGDDPHTMRLLSAFSYKPPQYTETLPSVDRDDIDPEILSSKFMWNRFDTNLRVDRRTANPVGDYPIDGDGYPLNPLGRTGLSGRGELPRWAVNYQTHLVILMGTNEMKSGREVFKYMMQKPIDHHHYRIPSTWTTGTTMTAITTTLKTFLMNIYQSWNNEEKSDSRSIDGMIEHLTFVSTAYIGKDQSLRDPSLRARSLSLSARRFEKY